MITEQVTTEEVTTEEVTTEQVTTEQVTNIIVKMLNKSSSNLREVGLPAYASGEGSPVEIHGARTQTYRSWTRCLIVFYNRWLDWRRPVCELPCR